MTFPSSRHLPQDAGSFSKSSFSQPVEVQHSRRPRSSPWTTLHSLRPGSLAWDRVPPPWAGASQLPGPSFTCCREKPILTPCCICYFALCFWLFLFTERMLSIQNGLPWGPVALCLNVNPECLFSGPRLPVGGYGKEEIDMSPP